MLHFGFESAQHYDEESGLHYNRHRYYDPAIGRYLTPDPIGLQGGLNLYAYVKNDPLNYIDPQGTFWIGLVAAAVGAVVGAAGSVIAQLIQNKGNFHCIIDPALK